MCGMTDSKSAKTSTIFFSTDAKSGTNVTCIALGGVALS